MTHSLRGLSAAALLALGLACGCSRGAAQAADVVITCAVQPAPPRVGASTVELSLADSAGHALSGARVRIEADMTHPGMAPVVARAREVARGRYRAAIDFTMAGDWVLLVEARLAGGRQIDRTIDVRGVQAR